MPFKGESTFTVTVIFYGLLFAIPLGLFYYLKIKSKNLLLVIVSILFSLFISEIALRFILKYPVTYSERQWGYYTTMYDSENNKIANSEQKKEVAQNKHLFLLAKNTTRDYQTSEFDYQNEKTNVLGLRGKLPSKSKKSLLTLGDSFTESIGAPTDSSYPFLLQKQLLKINPKLQVINGGVSGSDPFFEFKLLKHLHQQFPIYGVIFMINTSDVNDVMMRGNNGRFLQNGSLMFRKAPFWEPLYAVSYVFRLLIHSMGYNYTLMTNNEEKTARKEAINSICQLFQKEIIPWAKKENIQVYVVLQPMSMEVKNTKADYSRLNEHLSKMHIKYLNLRQHLKQLKKPEDLYWKSDGHFKSIGYLYVSTCIYQHFFCSTNKQ